MQILNGLNKLGLFTSIPYFLLNIMITGKDLERIHTYAVKEKKKIIFIFDRYKFRLVINSFIHAEDENEYIVQWRYAFGSMVPDQVLRGFKIKEIVIKDVKGEKRLKGLSDLLKIIPRFY